MKLNYTYDRDYVECVCDWVIYVICVKYDHEWVDIGDIGDIVVMGMLMILMILM